MRLVKALFRQHPWRFLLWVGIAVLASTIVTGVNPFLPLVIAVLAIAMLEGGLRILARR